LAKLSTKNVTTPLNELYIPGTDVWGNVVDDLIMLNDSSVYTPDGNVNPLVLPKW
jgi:hypothetical protein